MREIILPRPSRPRRIGDSLHTRAASRAGVLVSQREVLAFEARQREAKAKAEELARQKRVWSIVAPIMDRMGLDVPSELLAAWQEHNPDSYAAAQAAKTLEELPNQVIVIELAEATALGEIATSGALQPAQPVLAGV